MIHTQPFGSTGHDSTRIIFGAAALWGASEEDGERVLELLLEHGINHIDTAATYGRSERRVGAWMPQHRDRFFLATKTGERTYEKAKAQFEHSLERLQTDHVDLLQLHNLVDEDEWETALAPAARSKFAIEAREQGLTRFIGVTGHGVTVAAMHLRSLERFPFDSVLLPYNYVMMQNAALRRRLRAPRRRSARSAASPCRRSRASRSAPGTRRSTPTAPGTSRCPSRPTSTAPSTGCSAAPASSSTPPATSRSSRSILDAAERLGARPTDAEMAEMVRARGMSPLFV